MDALGINLPTSVVWLVYAIYFVLFRWRERVHCIAKGT